MPELPEVETVARQLAPLVSGRVVQRLEILDRRLGRIRTSLRGLRISTVSRVGKQLVVELCGPPRRTRSTGAKGHASDAADRLWLAVHLRMTGRLLWTPAGRAPPREHLRARLILAGGELSFVDLRRLGTLRIHRSRDALQAVGVEPLAAQLTSRVLADLLAGSAQPIKPWLLRQDRLLGIGNIYASEILHRAHIHPERPAGSLGATEARRLWLAVRQVLRAAIRHCGTTISDFQDARGRAGSFQRRLAVYGREGEPCRRCGGPVERRVQAGRSSYFCGRCQR
jgi:formamidopyrimidine-DNA glycosylase